MDHPPPTSAAAPDELTRRYKKTAMIVNALITLTLLLVAIVVAATRSSVTRNNPSLDIAWRILVPLCGLGAVVLRRTKFSAMRLQDIAALRGISGLLAALQTTTTQVALLGGAITLMGVAVTAVTGDAYYAIGSGIIALAVLLYCYPRKSAWQRVVRGIETTGDADDAPPAKGNVA
ncbi:MAG: hypothetical protein ABR577_17560 [Pyrinomonadaceae bacterium]